MVIFRTKKLHVFVEDHQRNENLAQFERTLTNIYQTGKNRESLAKPLLDQQFNLEERQDTYDLEKSLGSSIGDFSHTISHISTEPPVATRLRMSSMPAVQSDPNNLDLKRIVSISNKGDNERRARGSQEDSSEDGF